MQIADTPSPNFNDRPAGSVIDLVVLHYTGMETGKAALDRLRDPEAAVSAHYLVEEDGSVFRLVPETHRAWHAGVSYWAGDADINDRSVGIEIVNPGHEFGYRPFPELQMAAVETLLAGILHRHGIPLRRVVGHSDVAPSRKQDPGELFDWKRLADKGLSIWPTDDAQPAKAEEAPQLLAAIGYDPNVRLSDTVKAFQRRFVQTSLTGTLDDRTCAAIAAVHAING